MRGSRPILCVRATSEMQPPLPDSVGSGMIPNQLWIGFLWVVISLNAQEPKEAGEWVLKGCHRWHRESAYYRSSLMRSQGLTFVVCSQRWVDGHNEASTNIETTSICHLWEMWDVHTINHGFHVHNTTWKLQISPWHMASINHNLVLHDETSNWTHSWETWWYSSQIQGGITLLCMAKQPFVMAPYSCQVSVSLTAWFWFWSSPEVTTVTGMSNVT